MAIYEYRCPVCEKIFEQRCNIYTPIAKCPTCYQDSPKIMSRHGFNAYELAFERSGKIDGQNKYHK